MDGYDKFLSNDEYQIISISVTTEGTIDLAELEKNLIQTNVGGLSIQWANSETGVIQPIAGIIEICSRNEVLLHVDAAQAMGRINLDPQLLEQIDFLTFTAHKIHSLKGLGVICCGKEKSFDTLFPNPHTLNSPAIFALEPSLKLISDPPSEHLKNLRDSFENELKIRHPELIVNGSDAERLPNTTNLSFVGVDGAALVTLLDQHDVICSQLSACLIGRPEPSYVLTSMGIPEDIARSSIRFSFSKLNTEKEVETAVEIISKCYSELLTRTQLIAS
jgi:cysteine desulfurase